AVDRPPRLLRIANTLHLGELLLSESVLEAARADGRLELLYQPAAPPFDREGNLRDLAALSPVHR
ncbi:MAG: hypothetical protein ACRDGS_13415, partial [Chloroflexota bacterium]